MVVAAYIHLSLSLCRVPSYSYDSIGHPHGVKALPAGPVKSFVRGRAFIDESHVWKCLEIENLDEAGMNFVHLENSEDFLRSKHHLAWCYVQILSVFI